MTKAEKIGFKQRLLDQCTAIINDRIEVTSTAMAGAQEAANAEEKSSAGDKFETGRAMSHLQKEMHAGQLAATQRELAMLMTVKADLLYESVCIGAVVMCESERFFVAAGLGKINFEGKDIFIISPVAPLAKVLLGKVINEHFVFNKAELNIDAIF